MADIISMPPGPELDMLICEKVMGYKRSAKGSTLFYIPDSDKNGLGLEWWDYGNPLTGPWQPSRSISAAWQALEAFWKRSKFAKVKYVDNADVRVMKWEGEKHKLLGWNEGPMPSDETPYGCQYGEGNHMVWAPTAPLAICRAALLFVEHENA